jgi:DNA-binding NarL/FixJ family response regulator
VDRVRTLIASADSDARAGLMESLSRHPAISVGVFASDEDLASEDITAADAQDLEVVIWDFSTEAAPRRDVVAEAQPTPVIALVAGDGDAAEALTTGVHAVLPRDAEADLIASAAAAVARGLVVFDRAYAPGIHVPRTAQSQVPIEELTPRESDILQLLAEGMSNKGIAQRLGISEHTVKFHLNAILGKLDAHTRTEAVTRAARLGWIVL